MNEETTPRRADSVTVPAAPPCADVGPVPAAPPRPESSRGPSEQDGSSGANTLLTPRQCSVHTHTTLCDGKGTPEEMAASAYRMGVRYYGFSGHSHVPIPSEQPYVLPADMSEYRRRVLALRDTYAGRMEVLLGIEIDNLADVSPDGGDYWIGSVHDFQSPDGRFYGVDASPEGFALTRDELFHGDIYAFAEGYYAEVAKMAERKPTILGHIDLIEKFNADGRFFDNSHPRYRRAALDALHAADPAETLLEINTGALSRGWRTLYPAPFLLRAWREMNGCVILTADSHHPDTILHAYDQAAALAAAAGFRESAVLTREGVRMCPL